MATDDLLTPPERKPRRKAPKIAGGLVLTALAIAAYLYISSRGKERTDDAQIEGHVSPVAGRIAGQVKRVLVSDNQRVKKGDVLVELDDADFAVRAAAARADLESARAALRATEAQVALTRKQLEANLAIARGGVAQAAGASGATRAQIDQARADVGAAASRLELARTELARTQHLVDSGAVPRQELDARTDAVAQADASLDQARARLGGAEASRAGSAGTTEAARGHLLIAEAVPEQLAVAAAQVDLARARVDQAEAALRHAELDLAYTQIRAEVDGVVAKRTVEPGQIVSPDRPLLALVDTTEAWVIANFKETQLRHLRPGQRVRIAVDGFDGASFAGIVDSIQPGTGSRFSLLPPDNASGNFTKVTQRVPVKIVLADRHGLELRPGMSADVTVYTE